MNKAWGMTFGDGTYNRKIYTAGENGLELSTIKISANNATPEQILNDMDALGVNAGMTSGALVSKTSPVKPSVLSGLMKPLNLWGAKLIIPNQIQIQFGKTENQIYHAFRHTDEMGLDRGIVQHAIEAHFKTVSSQTKVGKPFNQIKTIQGQKFNIPLSSFKMKYLI